MRVLRELYDVGAARARLALDVAVLERPLTPRPRPLRDPMREIDGEEVAGMEQEQEAYKPETTEPETTPAAETPTSEPAAEKPAETAETGGDSADNAASEPE